MKPTSFISSLLFFIILFSCDPQIISTIPSQPENDAEKTFNTPAEVVTFLNSFQNKKEYYIKDFDIKPIQGEDRFTSFALTFKKSSENPYRHGMWEHRELFSKKDVEKFINREGFYKFMEFDFHKIVHLERKKGYHVFYLRTDLKDYVLKKVRLDEIDEKEIEKDLFSTLIKEVTIIYNTEPYKNKSSKQSFSNDELGSIHLHSTKIDTLKFTIKDSVAVILYNKRYREVDVCKEHPQLCDVGVPDTGGCLPIMPTNNLRSIIYHRNEPILTGFLNPMIATIIGNPRIAELKEIKMSLSLSNSKEQIALELKRMNH